MQTANIFPCNCQFAEHDKSLKGNVILKSTGWELSRWSCIPSWTGWQKLVEGQRQWNSWSCDPISLMTDSMWGRRIWEGDNTSSMQMWIYTKDMSEAIVTGVEVFFAPCPEFRNSMESSILGIASKPCLNQLEKQIPKSFFSLLLQWNTSSKELCLP